MKGSTYGLFDCSSVDKTIICEGSVPVLPLMFSDTALYPHCVFLRRRQSHGHSEATPCFINCQIKAKIYTHLSKTPQKIEASAAFNEYNCENISLI